MSEKPLREPTFLILTSLASGPKHGYAVLRDVEAMSQGRVRLRAATLYDALERLKRDGLAEVDSEEVVNGRHRRYYRVTGAGATRLSAEAEQLQRNATLARRSLRLGGLTA